MLRIYLYYPLNTKLSKSRGFVSPGICRENIKNQVKVFIFVLAYFANTFKLEPFTDTMYRPFSTLKNALPSTIAFATKLPVKS